jgi:uncharacterized membrane protein HdeD (DUF308 family)
MKHEQTFPAALKKEIVSAANWSIGLSILMILAGMLAIILPHAAGIAVGALIGAMLVFSGVAHLVYAWNTRSAGGVIWEVLVGLLYLGTGVYLLAQPAAGLASLTLALGLYLALEAGLEFALGYQFRAIKGSGWLVFDGVLTLLLAVLIWSTWPSNTPWVIGTLVGISMLFSGLTRLMLSLAVRSELT